MIQIEMEMVDKCSECRFRTDYDFCSAMPKNFCGNTSDEGKPDWCPLKNADGWISVKDRLPELGQQVLVYAVGKIDGFIGEHVYALCNRYIFRLFPSSPGIEEWSSPWQYFHTDYEITHWMPLPEGSDVECA